MVADGVTEAEVGQVAQRQCCVWRSVWFASRLQVFVCLRLVLSPGLTGQTSKQLLAARL